MRLNIKLPIMSPLKKEIKEKAEKIDEVATEVEHVAEEVEAIVKKD